MTTWRTAMNAGLYGPGGFFLSGEGGPSEHFRTSVHASPLFAGALLRLAERVDAALGHPKTFDLVDVGAGRGELLATVRAMLPDDLAVRARLTAVEIAPRPERLDAEIGWARYVPDGIVGLLIATEWLDNVPLDVADIDDHGRLRKVLVDPKTGTETLGGALDAADLFWLARWWPGAERAGNAQAGDAQAGDEQAGNAQVRNAQAGNAQVRNEQAGNAQVRNAQAGDAQADDAQVRDEQAADEQAGDQQAGDQQAGDEWVGVGRVEIGWPRDAAWADAVGRVRRGCALAVDYGHLRDSRPVWGTLAGFREGRQVAPVPDGSCDVTAHVAMDAVAAAAGTPYRMMRQRAALKALGIDGARPPIDLARSDPAAYLRALSAAGEAAELLEPAGLGGHWWLLHTVGLDGRGSMLL